MRLRQKYENWKAIGELIPAVLEELPKEKEEMAIIAKDTAGRDFVPAPEGLHPAVCVDVVDLGIVKSELYGPKHKIRISWQIDLDNEDGKPYLVNKHYTLSLHKKANLTKDLQTWRGKAFTEEERQGFDVERLVGVNCQIQIFHNKSGDGTTYANVQSVLPSAKGSPKLTVRDYTRVKDRPDYKPPVLPEEDSVFGISDDEDLDIPF